MSDRSILHSMQRPSAWAAALAGLALALAACSSGSPSQSSAPSESQAASQSSAPSESAAASESAAPSESQGVARCEVTPDAATAATITMTGFAFDSEATIAAGEAVEFHDADSVPHTVTEGSGGVAAADACVDKSLGGGARTAVTFNEPGDYQITCKIHATMQTVVHVQ
jgi:plastocyanin